MRGAESALGELADDREAAGQELVGQTFDDQRPMQRASAGRKSLHRLVAQLTTLAFDGAYEAIELAARRGPAARGYTATGV